MTSEAQRRANKKYRETHKDVVKKLNDKHNRQRKINKINKLREKLKWTKI